MAILPVLTRCMRAEIQLSRWELPGAAGAGSLGSSPTKRDRSASAGDRRALCPLQRVLAPTPQPIGQDVTTMGERARRQLSFLEMKTPTDTSQTLPCKTADLSTAVTDGGLALIHYMGKNVVALSSIRFLLICTIETYRNPEQAE